MALSKSWKKPAEIKQALKINFYGNDGCGKSLNGLFFNGLAIIDSEAKLGTYIDHEVFGKNILGVIDSSSYYDSIEATKELISEKKKACETLLIDSETKIYDSLSVSCMEVEEERAKKKGGEVTDQVVSQRGYGKIKLNASRLSALKAGASSKGITVITTAHVEDVFTGTGDTRVKVGERPALRKKAEHDYDIIIKFYREKDLGTGNTKFMAVVEKDTTSTFKLYETIDCTWTNGAPNSIIYDRLKPRIALSTMGTKGDSYGNTIDSDITKATEESKTADDIINEFTVLFKKLKDIDANKATIQKLLSENEIVSYKDHATVDKLKIVVAEMKNM